jgi:hypothetical protein
MVQDTQHSLQSRVEKQEREKHRRHVHAEAIGANADAQRQKEREHSRERQRQYRKRHRVQMPEHTPSECPAENDSPMDETGLQECVVDVDVCDTMNVDVETHPYLPAHQEQAIHKFLDRLLPIRDDLHECTTCLEKYHGMPMRGMECARCHNEVRF